MRRSHLTIDELDAAVAQQIDRVYECDFRRVRDAREHRFAEEHASDRDAVQSADELAVPPSLERVRPAEPVQAAIGAAISAVIQVPPP